MRSLAVVSLALAACLALAGCASSNSSARNFQGDEREVAQVISDLQSAGQRKNDDKICTEILSRALARQLSAQGGSCAVEAHDAATDADDYKLDVKDVTVTGSTATAKVENDDRTYTFRLAREGAAWKITSFGG